jgi:hypothetical protein
MFGKCSGRSDVTEVIYILGLISNDLQSMEKNDRQRFIRTLSGVFG